ncbi:hypothetical protein [Pyrodictium abyssi]|uniref:PIN domain-containing protein n=1 Tax=Pyrodictium abyssi TaxID=54256 RepID=A0ABM8J0E9_9CREN|nr:hypothetical protein PABY_18130 [Pyrodictium abyssi]
MRSGEVYYLDTSALVKRYLDEPGSNTVDALFAARIKAWLGQVSVCTWLHRTVPSQA